MSARSPADTAPSPRRRLKAERTRASILEAAEVRFAASGFAATRLEDVGADIGIGRSAILYHYRDKTHLYRAVIQDVFGGLLDEARRALTGDGSLPDRIAAAVEVAVEYVGRRPSTARIALREASSADPAVQHELRTQVAPLVELVHVIFEEGERTGLLRPRCADAYHFISAVSGTMMFYVAALPAFVEDMEYDPLSPEHLALHKQNVLHIARQLLGID